MALAKRLTTENRSIRDFLFTTQALFGSNVRKIQGEKPLGGNFTNTWDPPAHHGRTFCPIWQQGDEHLPPKQSEIRKQILGIYRDEAAHE